MRKHKIIAIAIFGLLIPGGIILLIVKGKSLIKFAYSLLPSRAATRATLRTRFTDKGLNPDWIDAIAYVESRWNPNAVNKTAGDLKRGGAFGATQMTMQTLREMGYTGTEEEYLADISLQGFYSAQYMAKSNPATFHDACAWWNAGRKTYDALPEGHRTRVDYVPKADNALAFVMDNPVSEAAA
jgi:hypothetical protein